MTIETCAKAAPLALPLALHLHGYPTVHLAHRATPLPLKHGLALLAYLADHPYPVGRDTLATLLWPEAAPGVGRTRLRRLVHALHERIGCTAVRGDHDALWLDEPVHVDLRDTESALARVLLARALDMPTFATLLKPEAGHVLAGFALDSDAFEDWLDQRRRVQQARLARALQRAAELARASHDHAAAQAAALALLRLQPHDALPLAA